VKHADGTWDSYDGGADVVFTLKHDLKPKFLALVVQDMRTTFLVDLPQLE
jgi:hypothetical protein